MHLFAYAMVANNDPAEMSSRAFDILQFYEIEKPDVVIIEIVERNLLNLLEIPDWKFPRFCVPLSR